jgi:hypothetical protein
VFYWVDDLADQLRPETTLKCRHSNNNQIDDREAGSAACEGYAFMDLVLSGSETDAPVRGYGVDETKKNVDMD